MQGQMVGSSHFEMPEPPDIATVAWAVTWAKCLASVPDPRYSEGDVQLYRLTRCRAVSRQEGISRCWQTKLADAHASLVAAVIRHAPKNQRWARLGSTLEIPLTSDAELVAVEEANAALTRIIRARGPKGWTKKDFRTLGFAVSYYAKNFGGRVDGEKTQRRDLPVVLKATLERRLRKLVKLERRNPSLELYRIARSLKLRCNRRTAPDALYSVLFPLVFPTNILT
jgi:hypothetical protein